MLANDHDLAARCYLRCQTIREETIGSDTVETATARNLAVCFHIYRHGEALAHFNLAHTIFEVLGTDFPRTQVAHMNLANEEETDISIWRWKFAIMFWIPYKGTPQGAAGKKKATTKKKK